MPADHCELCGTALERGELYVVRMDVLADPEMPPVSRGQLDALDFDAEMNQLLEQMKGMTAEELQNQVHQRFEFRICPACRRKFVRDPLGREFRMPSEKRITD
jgi:hypothetical protein